jgi:S-disulfanyl-L-cysteine oxidoreductase SoxD
MRFKLAILVLLSGQLGLAQLPTYHVGRAPTAQEIKEQDTYVGPSGEGLPQGRGTAKEGAKIFAQKCALCHGATGVEGKYPKLKTPSPRPFATTIWSMINSSMPRSIPDVGVRAEKLPTNDVYALTAFVLHLNGLVAEDAAIDQTNLAKVKMPTRNPQLEPMVEPPK